MNFIWAQYILQYIKHVPKFIPVLHNCFLKFQAQHWNSYIVPMKEGQVETKY